MSTNFSKQNSRLLFEKCKNNETEKALEMISNIENLRINVNERFEGGCTSFFISCYLGNLKLVQALVEIGKADITIESDNVRPFTVACVRGRIPVIDYLLTNFSDRIDPDSMITGCVGAAQYNFPQIVRRILGRGLDKYKK
ncbi:hypothetical protein DICPUDRAFT_79380 [Dictyostelium purpureum]|uniref:Uncharacterized protein n=1 Tax=Dictyostelium purpureum TaxID=5786 RepID=F0ZME7_DICPU|nr:uncharacterized protein DICPUDRAFT_79380 [Dictyostelium purpureum]EGC34886.1 hypothetical protein DICPUDRAFT_79380 [Dictyostelium purpureum]|eukprot:XP_003288578.1 hypothetical protein DICPUDRAFT_79380 [Dictyostelium purpureum]